MQVGCEWDAANSIWLDSGAYASRTSGTAAIAGFGTLEVKWYGEESLFHG